MLGGYHRHPPHLHNGGPTGHSEIKLHANQRCPTAVFRDRLRDSISGGDADRYVSAGLGGVHEDRRECGGDR